ncbi:MAG: hypothetical protein AAFR96_13480, partial [Planctomycetota bacterium]
MSESKPEAPLMIGVSGLRGIVGESLTPEVAMRFAGAFGAWLHDRLGRQPTVVVGRDGRAGGDELQRIVVDALLSAGCNVVDIGRAMTPTVGRLANHESSGYEPEAGVVLTASHNPAEWNGIKLLLCEEMEDMSFVTAAPSAETAAEIIQAYHDGRRSDASTPGLRFEIADASAGHANAVVRAMNSTGVSFDSRQASVVVDSVNASGSEGAACLFDRLGVDSTQLHGDNSGIFPHTPEPTAENLSGEGGLCDAVPGLKADVGFAQDPDGDRLAIVDETGRYIGEEYTLALCAVSILEAHQSRGREHAGTETEEIVLCANLSTSRMIDDIAAKYSASVVRTAVGEANVVEAMKRLKREGKAVLLGGEGNGGVIWP